MLSFDRLEMSLLELIAANPRYLGRAQKYGGLPFLLKLLAAEKPLSIQAHPNRSWAKEGFTRENAAGLALDAPDRSYKDSNHKPEIICGLTPFTGMCGFREPSEIRRLLEDFPEPAPEAANLLSARKLPDIAPLIEALETAAPLRNFLQALFGLSAEARQALTARIAQMNGPEAKSGKISCEQWELMHCFAELYPGDPAVISPLYLNVFHLEPGEAVFLEPGTIHSYIHGFGVELMTNSDNVLRAGLTAKHVDLGELMKILDFTPHKPEIIKPPPEAGLYTYPSPYDEFSLTLMRCGETIFEFAPAICVVTSGELEISGKKDRALLKPGESVFIPAESKPVFRGTYSLYTASANVK
jgi:mannose-6-phosphate isomerase